MRLGLAIFDFIFAALFVVQGVVHMKQEDESLIDLLTILIFMTIFIVNGLALIL